MIRQPCCCYYNYVCQYCSEARLKSSQIAFGVFRPATIAEPDPRDSRIRELEAQVKKLDDLFSIWDRQLKDAEARSNLYRDTMLRNDERVQELEQALREIKGGSRELRIRQIAGDALDGDSK